MLRTALVALVAVSALGAIISASASAAWPEFTGHKFPVKFTGSTSEHVVFQGSEGTEICAESAITGEVVGPKEVGKVVVTFSHCNVQVCGQGEFEKWKTKELKGRIGYLSEKEKSAGLLLEPVAQPFAKCTSIGGKSNNIEGSIIGKLGPNKISTKSYQLQYSGFPEKHQQWRHFEGEEVMHSLMRGPSNELTVSTNVQLTMEAELELRA
jgi:hypothetical protein